MTVTVDGSTVVVSGEVDDANRSQLADALLPVVAKGGDVKVDVRRVTFMDSAGVAVLVHARHVAVDNGGSMVVLASHIVHRALTVLALETLLGLVPED